MNSTWEELQQNFFHDLKATTRETAGWSCTKLLYKIITVNADNFFLIFEAFVYNEFVPAHTSLVVKPFSDKNDTINEYIILHSKKVKRNVYVLLFYFYLYKFNTLNDVTLDN